MEVFCGRVAFRGCPSRVGECGLTEGHWADYPWVVRNVLLWHFNWYTHWNIRTSGGHFLVSLHPLLMARNLTLLEEVFRVFCYFKNEIWLFLFVCFMLLINLEGIAHTKKLKTVSFTKSHIMSFDLLHLWNTKEDILRNISVFVRYKSCPLAVSFRKVHLCT